MKYLLFILLLAIVITNNTFSQVNLSSPYSSFGLGYINYGNNLRNKSMGGIAIGSRDYFTININNPASHTAFDSTSFVFEGAIMGQYLRLKTNDFNELITNGSISHLLFGFPVTRWWRSSLGLLPFSYVGYNVIDKDYHENAGNVQYNFEGEGGLSRFLWNNAFALSRFLSLGVNSSYLFGTINRQQTVTFPDSNYVINTKIDDALTIKDLYFEFGLQYYTNLKEDLKLIAGATYRPQIQLASKKNYLARTYLNEINDVIIYRDTIKYLQDFTGTTVMPQNIGIGFSFNKTNFWQAGIDYQFEQWQNYESFGIQDSLQNSHIIRFGGQLIPDNNSSSYLKRIDYRVGANFNSSYLNLRNEDINSFGITFGMGLPIRSLAVRGSMSMLNVGFEIGRRGTLQNNLIREDFYNFYLSVSIYELWFVKIRYQ